MAVTMFIAVNIISEKIFSNQHIDLTNNNIYTISEGTRITLKSLDEQIRIKLYYSEEQANGYPNMQAYAVRVKNLLKQYAKIAGEKIELEFVNTRPYTKEEDFALSYGLRPMQIDADGTKLFFGIVVSNSVDDNKVITFLSPNRAAFLEYDITNMVYNLSRNERPVVGVMSWLPMRFGMVKGSQPPKQWAILEQMEKFFEVKYLDNSKTQHIDDDVEILMVVHPAGVGNQQQYAIDQFVMRGGKLLVFVDSFIESPNPTTPSSNLSKLFDKWGIKVAESKVVADKANAVRIPSSHPESSLLNDVAKLSWLELSAKNINDDNIITNNLSKIRMLSPTHISLNKNAKKSNDYEFVPLIITSKNSMLYDNKRFINGELAPSLAYSFAADDKEYILAASYKSSLKSAFPRDIRHASYRKKTDSPANIIIVGDTDMLENQIWTSKQQKYGQDIYEITSDNGSLVINILDYLSGSDALISLRSRSQLDEPLKHIMKLKQDAETKFRKEEQRLRRELRSTESRLNKLRQTMNTNNSMLLDDSRQAEIQSFRDKMLKTRENLRDTRFDLREDINSLVFKLKWLNIGIIPIILILLSLIIPYKKAKY